MTHCISHIDRSLIGQNKDGCTRAGIQPFDMPPVSTICYTESVNGDAMRLGEFMWPIPSEMSDCMT